MVNQCGEVHLTRTGRKGPTEQEKVSVQWCRSKHGRKIWASGTRAPTAKFVETFETVKRGGFSERRVARLLCSRHTSGATGYASAVRAPYIIDDGDVLPLSCHPSVPVLRLVERVLADGVDPKPPGLQRDSSAKQREKTRAFTPGVSPYKHESSVSCVSDVAP